MADKFYGDRPRSYIEMANEEERRIDEYTRRANRESDRRRMFAGEYDPIMPGLTDEDAAAAQRDAAKGLVEVPMTIGSSILADIPAGWAGINAIGPEKTRIKETGEDVLAEQQLDPATEVERYQEALTYMPRSESGKRALAMLGKSIQTLLSPATRATDAALAAGAEADRIPMVTVPLTVLTAAAEAIPGRRPAAAATRAAERTGRAAADVAGDAYRPGQGQYVQMADEMNVDELIEMAQIAESRDPNVTMAAQGGAPMQRPELAGQNLPPPDRPLADTTPVPEGANDEVFDWNAGNARPRGPGRSQRGAVENTGAGQQVLATQAGRNVATNTAEIVRGQPAPQDLPPVNVKTPGAKVGNMERRVGTTGAYRGAPRNVTSPQKLGKMRKDLIASLERGAPGRAWYDRSSEAALELTGDRPNLRDRYVGSIAVTSADTAVPSNAGFAIKGYNQLNAGDPVHTGRYPQRMSKDIEAIASGEEKMLSDKVGPFYEANKISDLGKDVRPTNDLWMARAFGYTQKDPKTGEFVEWSSGLGEAQHRFMDEEINRLVDIANERKLGGHDDWTPERVQAAIWVDTKARREGTSIERAATDFATDLDARSINITSETTPANSLNHMPGVYGNEARGQLAFEQQNRIMTDEKGRNILSTGARALTRPQTTGAGVYEGASNPVAVNRILGSTETGVPTMDPSSRKIAETVASTEGLLKGQESVGYNFLRPPKKVGDANAAVVAQVDDLTGFQKQLDDEFGGAVIATPSEEGIRILKIDGEPFDAKQRKALQGIVGEKPDWKINSGDLVGGFGDYKPSNYLNTIDETVAGSMDVNTRWAAKALEDLDASLAKEFPDAGPRNEILQKTRQALSEGGIARVRELVKQGVLPAIVIGVLAGGQAGSPESQRQQT